ncbi:GTP cyclohydrolase N terminal-domain-containing protein [Irpex lacteus]|nr:GTP cyclohydrolase N terminal-domain-containing protein [Irpex lacteus]
MSTDPAVLTQISQYFEALQVSQQALHAKLDNIINGQLPVSNTSSPPLSPQKGGIPLPRAQSDTPPVVGSPSSSLNNPSLLSTVAGATQNGTAEKTLNDKEREKLLYPSRVMLTIVLAYPDQHGIKPYPLTWGAADPATRGPVICSRLPTTIKQRNAIGAHSGSYSIYRALAIAMGTLNPSHKPDYSKTEPAVPIPPQPSWSDPHKIVSFDPWGHLVPHVFKKELEELGLDVSRVSLSLSARKGELKIDGKILLKSHPLQNADGTKAAVEPVWWLPGIAERFGISEGFFAARSSRTPEECTLSSSPAPISRYSSPIGNLTAYICNGSDVFGSDICTCKPYSPTPSKSASVAHNAVASVLSFTSYLVYNLRKRGGDSADKYFKATELIAGVKDMRFQALMPDVLHWLGIKKIDNMVSMSDMKYNAIVQSGIPIHKRYDIPDHLLPPDSRVEIDAKIAAGYFTSGKQITEADLVKTVGRTWEETEH